MAGEDAGYGYTIQRWEAGKQHPQTVAGVAALFRVNPQALYELNRDRLVYFPLEGRRPTDDPLHHPLMAGCVLLIPEGSGGDGG